ncbi:MAG TPA: DUF4010 domain-containing protein [Pseudobdellovibrionaceae bacterium]|jgi:uncharacterized membrane protein (DUF4010 family)
MELRAEDIQPLHQILISLMLGMLVGLQRQWADPSLGGIRTFPFIALLGTTCAVISEKIGTWMMGLGFFAILCLIILGNLIKRFPGELRTHSRLGTELAMLLVFMAGAMVRIGPTWLAAALAGIVAVVLHAKIELHGMASRFNEKELKAIMQFTLISLVIFPLVPNESLGPMKIFNPRDVWLMVVLIVAISLGGYIIYKFFGRKAGILLGGILGGIISSTATTVTQAKMNRQDSDKSWTCALVIIVAWATVYIRLAFEVGLVAPSFGKIWFPLLTLFVAAIVPVPFLWKKASQQRGMPLQSNPTELKTAFVLAALYSVILFAVAFAKKYAGTEGLYITAFLSGITDMDAITLSTSRLVENGTLIPEEGWRTIVIAVISNTTFKGLIARFWGGKVFFRILLVPWTIAMAAGIALLIFF